MRTFPLFLIPLSFTVPLLTACDSTTDPEPDPEPETRPFEMTAEAVVMDWAVTREQEMPCGGREVGGGSISGTATFTDPGELELELSSVWDIANLMDPEDVEYEPEGPAGGPVAPVFGQAEYPYDFYFNPLTAECESAVSATGEAVFEDAEGNVLYGLVTGGETHRLDFEMEGDGIETFAVIEFDGGTGPFEEASGSFVAHTIARFDFQQQTFVLDLVDVLEGGTITY